MEATATIVTARPKPDSERPHRSWPTAATLLLVLASALFLGVASRTVTAPFGDSHDGRNAGVWASGSHSLRQDGVTGSRLGTRSPENGVYANHPPLIYLKTALAETLGRGSALATRAPAWLGSLAVIALLAVLLKDRGLRPGPVGVAVALVVTTPMFLVYGTMLDTPVTSLPFGLALLLLWGRARDGRPVRPPVAFAFAALAVVAGWQSLAVAAVLAAWAVVRLVRRRDGRVVDAAFAAGALTGVILLLAWLLWAFDGSLAHLWEQIVFRTGQGDQSVPLIDLLGSQRRDVQAHVRPGIRPGRSRAWGSRSLSRRTRSLAVVALSVTVPYPLLFPAGAANHDYWNFWLVLPLAVGLAAGGHWSGSTVTRVRRPDAVLAVAGGLLAVVATVGVVVRPPAAAWTIREGIRGWAGRRGRPLGAGPANGLVRGSSRRSRHVAGPSPPTARRSRYRWTGWPHWPSTARPMSCCSGSCGAPTVRRGSPTGWRRRQTLAQRPPEVTRCQA